MSGFSLFCENFFFLADFLHSHICMSLEKKAKDPFGCIFYLGRLCTLCSFWERFPVKHVTLHTKPHLAKKLSIYCQKSYFIIFLLGPKFLGHVIWTGLVIGLVNEIKYV